MDSGSAHGLYIPLYACRGKNMQVGEKKYPLLRKKDNLLLTFTVRHIIWNAKLGNNEKKHYTSIIPAHFILNPKCCWTSNRLNSSQEWTLVTYLA